MSLSELLAADSPSVEAIIEYLDPLARGAGGRRTLAIDQAGTPLLGGF